jgi:hypothetical protein
MAERPIFIARPESPGLVEELFLELRWHSGFAPIQKERNIKALHETACAAGLCNILEVSSKSDKQRGQHLSAFYLKVKSASIGETPLECAFQGSKVFERGGPFTDLYRMEPKEAKRDPRLQQSGPLVGFQFDGFDFPLEPKTVFYDWLYAGCIYPHREWARKLLDYSGFSDIEFNPNRSINCQARSIALFLSLLKRGQLDEAVRSPSNFILTLLNSEYRPKLRSDDFASKKLFPERSSQANGQLSSNF